MVQVQRGDTREYIQSQPEAVSDLSAVGNAVANLVDIGSQIKKINDSSKMSKYAVDINNEMFVKNNEINTKYQADPFSENAIKERQQAFNQITAKYDEQFKTFSSREWQKMKDDIYGNYKTYNTKWSVNQSITNAQVNMKNSITDSVRSIGMLARNGATDEQVEMQIANNKLAIRNGAVATLGEVVVNDAMKDYTRDCRLMQISETAVANPPKAQKMLQDKKLQTEINDPEALDKLKAHVNQAVLNYHNEVAVNELCSSLRNLTSPQAEKILSGKASYSEVSNFIQKNKRIPMGSKEIIASMYNIGTKANDFVLNLNSGLIEKRKLETGGSGSGSGSYVQLNQLKKLPKNVKSEIGATITNAITDIVTFSDNISETNPNKLVKTGKAPKKQSFIQQALGKLIGYQGALDIATQSGCMTKNDRNRLINQRVLPFVNYLENNLSRFETKGFIFNRQALGYEKIKRKFDYSKLPKNQKIAMQKDLLVAQTHYFNSLEVARQKKGLNSIYELESLPLAERKKIYNLASDNAIAQAQKYSNNPEMYFAKQYPALYSQGVEFFGIKNGTLLARQVAKVTYGKGLTEYTDIQKEMGKAISNLYANLSNNSKTTLKNYIAKTMKRPVAPGDTHSSLSDYWQMIDYESRPKVMSKYRKDLKVYGADLEKRFKELGITEKDIQDTMKANHVTREEVLAALETDKLNSKEYDKIMYGD